MNVDNFLIKNYIILIIFAETYKHENRYLQ